MKKSHENWNDYHTASTDYPDALYKNTDRLEERIRKESRKRKLLYTTIPTTAAALLFVILINTSIVFARTISEIPILSKISEMVMYNESLKSAVENRNIQYVNLKAVNDEMELSLPYVIADSRNLVLFLEMPDNLDLKENEFYHVSVDHLTDLSTGDFISSGFLSYSGSYSKGQDPFIQISLEFIERDLPGYPSNQLMPQNFDLSLSLRKYKDNSQNLLALDSFKFTLSLEDFKEPVVYPLNQEIILDGQKIIFKEMISYPTRSEIIFDLPDDNDALINLRLSLVEDGVKTSLASYAFMSTYIDGVTRETIHIRSSYFDPPESRSISIDRYTKIREEEQTIIVDIDKKTMTPETEGIELIDIERVDGELIFTFKTSDSYPYAPFGFISDQGQYVEIIKEATRGTETDPSYLYFIEDDDYKTLEFFLSPGPETTLDKPILIPIPVNN